MNISNYEPLLGGSFIPLPKALNNSMKGLINFKNRGHQCFLWCHARLIINIYKLFRHYISVRC